MYQRILVPVDGSSFSHQILPLVDVIAQATGAQVALFRALDKGERAGAESELTALADARGAQVVAVDVHGDIADAILAEADRVPGTLVAMSSHGRSGVLRAVLGSTALNVLRQGRKPLLVYRPHEDAARAVAPLGRIERVFVPLDGSALSESIVPQAIALAKWLNARPVLLSVVDPEAAGMVGGDASESGYVHTWATRIRHDHGLDAGWEVLHGDPKHAIAEFVRGWPNSMLAMTTRGRSALQSAIVGGVTTAALRESGLPVYASVG